MSVDDVIRAATGLARDAAEGRLDTAGLQTELTAQCRRLFGVVAGGDDPLFTLQRDVAREVIEVGGIGLDEMRQWVAVLEGRAQH